MYDRSHCTRINQSLYQKNIWSLGFEQKQAILIDDFDFQMECQPDNCIRVKSFEGDAADRELYRLYPFLQKLSQADDVRPVQKNLNEHLEAVRRSKEQKVRVLEENDECEIDLDEGCHKSCIRTFECCPSMKKINYTQWAVPVC